MPEPGKRQISFKLDPEIAQRLDAVAANRGISCHEAARSLMLTALAGTPKEVAAAVPPTSPTSVTAAVLGDLVDRLRRIEEAVTLPDLSGSVAELLAVLVSDQTSLLRAARLAARESAHLRSQHLPALRRDIQTAVVALLCKGPVPGDPAKVSAWVRENLNPPIPGLGDLDA